MQSRLNDLGYITVAQAAKITGLTEGTIRFYLSQGVFTRHKIGYAVFLDEEEVINYRNREREGWHDE